MWIKESCIIPLNIDAESDSNKSEINSNELAKIARNHVLTFEMNMSDDVELKSISSIYSIRNTGDSYQIYVYFPLAWNVTAMIIDGNDIIIHTGA